MPTASGNAQDGLRILIVEDHADSADSTAMFLRMYGHRVEIARNGPAAIEMSRAIQPHVVLLDLSLPEMNAYEVARKLTEVRPRFTPLIIAISGYPVKYGSVPSTESGIDYHMVKPVNPDDLQAILMRFQSMVEGLQKKAAEFLTAMPI
jgi:CheY-like chemotaxis protein